MDVVERLSLEAVRAHTLMATEHLHRYEVSAALCAGLRVIDLGCGTGYGSEILRGTASRVVGIDNDVATIDAARASVGRRCEVTFEAADAHAFLRRDLVGAFDALVAFETLEHLANLEDAWASLRRHASEGLKLILSVPNSLTYEEENPFHLTDFGYEQAIELFSSLDDVVLAYQFNAEGSLIALDRAEDHDAEVTLLDRGEPAYASHFLAFVNFGGEEAVAAAAGARMRLKAAPVPNRYLRELVVANRELARVNARLARTRLAPEDRARAAEAQLRDREARLAAAEQTIEDLKLSASWRITRPLRAAKAAVKRLLGS